MATTVNSARTNEGLAIVIGSGWITFFQIRHLESTCVYVCRESRRQVARTVRVTAGTPRTLWRRAPFSNEVRCNGSGVNNDNGNDDRRVPTTINLSNTAASLLYGTERNRLARSMGGGGGQSSGGDARSEEDTREGGKSCGRHGSLVVGGEALPLVRVAGVIWSLPVAELLSEGFRWPEGMKEIKFWGKFEDSVEDVDFPDTLEALSFGFRFNRPLHAGCIRWPPGLKRLKFGAKWNQDIWGARESWPASLEELHFGTGFEMPLSGDGIGLPPGLRVISLGGVFDEPIQDVEWPVSLQKLTFSDNFNQELEDTSFPPGLREITFGADFDREIDGVFWPEALERLTFGESFNQPFVSRYVVSSRGSPLPVGLKVLVLGDEFDCPMSESELPEGLEQLIVGRAFSFASSVRWPSGLKNLYLSCSWGDPSLSLSGRVALPVNLEVLNVGNKFNSSLERIAFPSTLKVLILGSAFDQRIDEGIACCLPEGLEELRFGAAFNRGFHGVQFPKGMKRVIFAADCKFNKSVDRVSWPPGLEELEFGNCFNQSLEGSILPWSLKVLRFGWAFSHSLQGVALPEGLRELSFPKRYPAWHVKGLEWPRSLRAVYIGSVHFRTREALAKWAMVASGRLKSW